MQVVYLRWCSDLIVMSETIYFNECKIILTSIGWYRMSGAAKTVNTSAVDTGQLDYIIRNR